MKQIILFLISTLIITSCSDKNNSQVNFSKVYEGQIDKQYEIVLKLNKKGDSLDGEYYYTKYNSTIQLKGTIKDNIVVLNEFDKNGNQTGIFNGELKDNKIEGLWSKPNGEKSKNFFIQETDKSYSAKTEEPKEESTQKPNQITNEGITVKWITLANVRKKFNGLTDSAVFRATYPQITGLSNEIIQNKINGILKMTEKDIADNIRDLDDGFSLEYDFEVPVLTKNIISISFNGERNGGAHPFYSPFMDNKTFDLKTGKTISFVDIIPSNKTVQLNKIINDIAAHNDNMLQDLRPLTVNRDASFYLSKEGLVILLFQDVNFKEWVSATGRPFDICIPYDKLKSINPTFVETYQLEK
jgi:hypothetical protein